MHAFSGHAFEVRQAIEGEVHFAGGAAILVAADLTEEVFGDVTRLDKVDEGVLGIDTGGDDVGVDLLAVGEHHALRSATLDENFRGGSLGADLNSGFAG